MATKNIESQLSEYNKSVVSVLSKESVPIEITEPLEPPETFSKKHLMK